MRAVISGALALLLASLVPAGPTSGHPGLGGGVISADFRLQLEQYNTPDGNCDPDRDSEHISVQERSGIYGTWMPFSRCGVTFASVYFPTTARADSFRVERYAVSGLTMDVQVYIDGSFRATGRFTHHASGPTTHETFPFTGTSPITPGYHSVRVEFRVVSGFEWYNLWIDWVSFLFDCVNEAPVPVPTADGLGTGMYGWGERDYTFDAGPLVDVEGDPFTVTWQWDDGPLLTGLSADRPFPPATVLTVYTTTIRVVEDVSARCPGLGTWDRSYGPFTFTVLPDPLVTHRAAAAGNSCNGGLFLPSWLADDVVLGTCPIGLTVDGRGAPAGLISGATFRLDGIASPPDRTSPPERDIDAVLLGAGTHAVEACASGVGDKYGRLFCSTAYTFRSIPCGNAYARFTTITTDGLGGTAAGWKDRAYTLTASGVTDPDGDPLSVRWEWSDATSSAGPSVTRAFPQGDTTYSLRLEEDLGNRCPAAGTVPTVYGAAGLPPPTPLAFRGLADWAPILDNPGDGSSCVYTVRVDNMAAQADTMVGTCRVRAHVVPGTTGIGATGELVFDATETLATRTGTDLWAWYESMEQTTGRHWFQACFEADSDKYDRRFCTPAHAFWNVGRG